MDRNLSSQDEELVGAAFRMGVGGVLCRGPTNLGKFTDISYGDGTYFQLVFKGHNKKKDDQ